MHGGKGIPNGAKPWLVARSLRRRAPTCGAKADGSKLRRRVDVDQSHFVAALKSLDNRALATLVTLAVLREMPEGGGHLLQFPRLPLEDVDVLKGNPLHVRAGAITIPPQGDEFRDLLDGEAEVAGAADEAEGGNVVPRVHPVPGFGPDGPRDQSNGLVVMFFSLNRQGNDGSGAF